jgi:hypothetical protein
MYSSTFCETKNTTDFIDGTDTACGGTGRVRGCWKAVGDHPGQSIHQSELAVDLPEQQHAAVGTDARFVKNSAVMFLPFRGANSSWVMEELSRRESFFVRSLSFYPNEMKDSRICLFRKGCFEPWES